jgi:N-acetylmuramoyl-L-alanine amidase
MLEAALICLATNVFHEARGESVLGQYAVAQVTMRRANNDPARVCKEVYRPFQFSWTIEGKPHPNKIHRDAYDKALRISWMVLSGRMPRDFSNGATHYHATSVRPSWSLVFQRTNKLGAHIFYKS